MAFYKKRKDPYLTQADREAIANISDNKQTRAMRFKAIVTYKKDGLNQQICMTMYGETEDQVKSKSLDSLQYFKQNDDPTWKIVEIDWKKNESESKEVTS